MKRSPRGRKDSKSEIYLLKSKIKQLEAELKRDKQFGQSLNAKRPLLELLKVYDSFDKIHDSLTCILIIVDPELRIISWNKIAEKVTGYSREEVLGKNEIWELLYPDSEYRREIFKLWGKKLQEGIVNQESIIVAKDGKKKVVSWHSNTLIDEKGKVRGILALGANVTEERAIEEQIRLKEKMDSLERLAGHIAHDFNNIFSIIQGYVELVLEQMDYDAPGREDLLEIEETVKRGTLLTEQLLTFSKRQVLKPTALNLNHLLSEMRQTLKRALGDQIELILILAKDLPTINADPGLIQQILLNLAVNAREAMPEGGKFTISTSIGKIENPPSRTRPFAWVMPGDYVLLLISDTGPGIEPELKERIFEPFLSSKTGRSGCGLSSIYGIVNQHNGYIWVESEPGKGTTFKIYLPISGKPETELKSEPCAPMATELPKGTESILLVEHNEYMRALAVRILRSLGYRVIEASNPQEALSILQLYPEPVQLLVTDVEMPIMNGAQLAEQALKIKPDLKVLYFSGYSLEYLLDKKILKPEDELVTKPFSIHSLSQKVRQVLDQKQ